MIGPDRVQAPFGARAATIAAAERHGAYTVLRGDDPAGPRPQAGQFYMLAAARRWGAGADQRPYLPRAFSVLRAPAGGHELHFLIEDVGPGTRRLCELEAGDELSLMGPLGIGFAAPRDGRRAILAGGGVGIAPLGIWQDVLSADADRSGEIAQGAISPAYQNHGADSTPTVLLGFRDALHAQGARLLRDARVATDDGSAGHHGRVTELLATELAGGDHAEVYACGPPPMLEAVRALCAERDVPAQLALESGMACGFGACFGCVVATRDGYIRVCVDGPVIEAARLQTALTAGVRH
ncbi:MAG TPA: dihydroorotate dehydrogenase electron transfer subunit [Solirubrobacteraceae bacterium]|nr:dihydroorotate dehydrogenase electron transfer subunit [Solirubrobacteraceae bacterium]